MMILLFIIAAYLLGSISSGVVVSQIMQLPDPRESGSKNPGATNVLRVGNKMAALYTLLGDSLKGVIPVVAAKLYGLPELAIGWIALAVFLGHLYPVFFAFKGGKGVATFLGVLFALAWPLGLTVIIIWLITARWFGYSSLAAIISAICATLLTLGGLAPHAYLIPIVIISAILIARHYANIQRLLAGTEPKIGSSKK